MELSAQPAGLPPGYAREVGAFLKPMVRWGSIHKKRDPSYHILQNVIKKKICKGKLSSLAPWLIERQSNRATKRDRERDIARER